MQPPSRSVRVSASTSNLGPGFDLAGLALDLFLDVELRAAPRRSSTGLELGDGCEEWPPAEDNRLIAAFVAAARARNLDPRAYVLSARTEIPLARGFGSSAAASVAGVLLAESLCDRATPRDELLDECVALEAHPDNATPALLGGFTLSFPIDGRVLVIEAPVSESLGFCIAWPEVPLETGRARALLPASVPFADAAENPKRLAALLEGLRRGDPALISAGAHDALHERYRLPAIVGAREALDLARSQGAHAALISGSGSGVFAICARGDEARIAAALVRGFESRGARAVGREAHIVRGAPRVRTH